jgi:hypothetical protein
MNARYFGLHMFRGVDRIVLAAVLAVAVAVAMAAPASARALAARQDSTPTPAAVTGTMTWTYLYTPMGRGESGDDKQTITSNIGLTGLDPVSGKVTGNTTTYSFTDDLNETSVSSYGCKTQVTGSYSSGGPVAMNASPATIPAYGGVFFTGLTQAEVALHISYAETQTIIDSGPSPDCYPSTSTSTVDSQANTWCLSPAGAVVPGGPLKGTYPNATVNLDCSGTAGNQYWHETMTVTGTLTITPSCGSAAAASSSRAQPSLAAASSCGLAITSPQDNSTVALSDEHYVDGPGLPITATSREPDPDQLKLKVSGTSTCSGPVTVGGVSATADGDNWKALIPVAPLGYGPVTLTAKAAGCNDASSNVTLINLEIIKPVENDSLPITAEPAMPDLNAKISVLGYTGDTSGVRFDWTLEARGETVSRVGTPRHWVGKWDAYSRTIATGSTKGTGEAWKPSFDEIVGGVGRLTVTASLPGVPGTVASFPRWINIPGSGLPDATVEDYVNQHAAAQYAPTISQVFCYESSWTQFNPKAVNGDGGIVQPPIPNVPDDWAPNPGPRQPEYGHPAGIGIAQLDPEPGTLPLADYWNWHTNVEDGIALFEGQKLPAARRLVVEEQDRLIKRRDSAIAKAKANREKNHDRGSPRVPPLITVPQLSDEEILWQAVRLYNGQSFNEFHFNADYILSADGLDVLLVHPDTQAAQGWVGGGDLFSGGGLHGVPPSPAGSWAGSGNHSRPMRWVEEGGDNQSYDEQVRVCQA